MLQLLVLILNIQQDIGVGGARGAAAIAAAAGGSVCSSSFRRNVCSHFFQGLVRVCLFSYSPAESTRRIFHELRRSSTGKAYRRSFSGVGGLNRKLPGTLIFGGADF